MTTQSTAQSTTSTANPITDLEQAVEKKVEGALDAIKQYWNVEEPILVGEVETWFEQLAGIATSALVGVLSAVASGSIKSTEAFGQVVVSTYQNAITTGLGITIVDAQQAAKQVVTSAQAKVAAPAQN